MEWDFIIPHKVNVKYGASYQPDYMLISRVLQPRYQPGQVMSNSLPRQLLVCQWMHSLESSAVCGTVVKNAT